MFVLFVNLTNFIAKSVPLEKRKLLKNNQARLKLFFRNFLFIRDHEGIQTPDRWSRNPVLYSAELRGLFNSEFLR